MWIPDSILCSVPAVIFNEALAYSFTRRQSEFMQGNAIRRVGGVIVDALIRMSRTRINYWLEFVLDSALGGALLTEGVRCHSSGLDTVLLVVCGLLLFSFIEYCFHRWLLHGSLRLLAQRHSAHHGDPLGYDSMPFFLPALALLGLTGVAVLLMPEGDALLVASGIAFGYVTYGLSHFMIHHRRFRHALIRSWAANHHIHHHHPRHNFGVTSPLWDVLLRTRYVSAQGMARPHSSLPS